jgi:hypothetical protein
MTASNGNIQDDALSAIATPDEHYLRTTPRQRFTVAFDVGRSRDARMERTYLLASQGYYTEWVRGAWIADARDTTTFVPSVQTLVRAMEEWRVQRDSMEQRFFRSRIPVF